MKLSTKHIKEAYVGLKERIHSFVDSIWIKNVKCTLESITLLDYMSFRCDYDLKALLKVHIYTPKRIIIQGWQMIEKEYKEASTASDVKQQVEREAAIKRLQEDYDFIAMCLIVLTKESHKASIDILTNRYLFPKGESCEVMVKRGEARLKGILVNINSLKDTKKDKSEVKQLTRNDFYDELIQMQQWYGQAIPEFITMIKYVSIQNRYLRYAEELKRQNDKQNG